MRIAPLLFGLCAVAVTCVCVPAAAARELQRFESPATRAALVELYTSEGCSSCPPADVWLSGLAADPRLWHSLVPVAFHVDYWDALGWPDRLATAGFSARQRRHVARGHVQQVYTPGFVVAGREWRGWFSGEALAPAAPPAGVLRAAVDDAGSVTVTWLPAAGADSEPEAQVALLGFGLASTVRSGENAGRKLHHDFAVLALADAALQPAAGGDWQARLSLPRARLPAQRYALAVWVEHRGDPAPLQATGGWLVAPPAGP